MALTQNSICDFGWKARDFALKGIDGKTYSLADVRGPNGTLVVFICNHCPYVKASIGRLGAMTASSTVDARAFGGGGIRAASFGGGFRGFGGGGLRTGFAGPAFRGGLVAPGRLAFRPGIGPRFGVRSGIGPRFGFRNRVFFANRFFPRRSGASLSRLCRSAFMAMAPRAGAGFRPLGAGSYGYGYYGYY
jgi:hypothetical protein